MAHWATTDIPPQNGKVAIVTGATSGLGLEAARELARAGARVILAGRNPSKGAKVVAKLRLEMPAANIAFAEIDLGSLASVRAFARTAASTLPPIEILLNNAGLAMLPDRQETEDGFERQFGTNHLGHFALTALLFPHLAPAARVITVASTAHRSGTLNLADLNLRTSYKPMTAYAQSKLANLVFAIELDRRIKAAGGLVQSIAAHPGLTATNLFTTGQEIGRGNPDAPRLKTRIIMAGIRLIAMRVEKGVLPILYAATAPEARGGLYYGPDGWGENSGWPGIAKPTATALDQSAATALWEQSEALTGLRFSVAA